MSDSRPLAATEHSWCKAVLGGTGITVLSLLLNKPPDNSFLQCAIHRLQNSHPILRSKLHFEPMTNSFSFFTPRAPDLNLQPFDLQSTSHILCASPHQALSPFHKLIEHELNQNPWTTIDHDCSPPEEDADVLYASVYTIEEGAKWMVVLKLHTAACDRTAAVSLSWELMRLMSNGGGEEGVAGKGGVNLGIEEYIPSGKGNKPFWARGMDMLGYSLNSFRLSNLEFVDSDFPRRSEMVRLQLDSQETSRLLQGCRSSQIKLCGALASAGLIAARSLKQLPDGQWEKYAVATLIDCRSILEPPLSAHDVGFYHSAIINTHDMKGDEDLWELARRIHDSYQDAKTANKHFTDMSDLNFLMCKAIENPSATPSSSLRTSFVSVFEDPVIDKTVADFEGLGVEDYVGCASVHGVGPSIALFDTIRDGRLDCAFVYPAPLHSREQMLDLISQMKRILVDG